MSFHPHDATSSPFNVSTSYFREHYEVPLAACAVYVLAIAVGHSVMKQRDPWRLKPQLAAWNFFLALFSLVGASQTAPVLLTKLFRRPLLESICVPPSEDWGAGACGLWVQIFVLSKFAELADTVFIVLRKRKLLFLHWYHHLTVLLYCWHAYATEAPHALWFVSMNYCVHAIMYTYYALMAFNMGNLFIPPEFITAAQISQMIVGVSVQCAAMRVARPCDIDGANLVFGALMYLSYFFLFMKFALQRFVFKTNSRGTGLKDFAGHGDPPSLRTVFPLCSSIVDSLTTKMRKTLSFPTLAPPSSP
ncbi:hypothetical protein CTAYLR_002968 [Chrysophaeum taylorii]|uniref:Elongation of fatty acids protein n=1 Tax=Chrysophaeum taylorii TaxID=2483200 RepID=A0AAD7U512_9STRA|nr:hypothetical protein CTAYLR_002968 [Chrysophaeum taylorii]